jgi:cobalt-precorrin 5A hydrolase
VNTWVIGIGCRRGVSVQQIHAAVFAALGARPFANVRALASIDRKKDETALIEFAARHGLPLQFFPKQHIAQTETSASQRLQKLLASRDGRIIVPKIVADGVTVAIAEDNPKQQTDNERM